MSRSPDYDVIVVGAGHNGLAATALLAGRGLRVLCLEKNAYVGGMAETREILTGCRNDVGASLLFLPDLRDCIVERAVFSSDHFAAMQGATNGDFTHGLIHPEQMIGGRLLVPGSSHATPIANLYLCGASCHPGPGVTFLPGYGAAYEVAEALGAATRSPARSAA
jgi:phytoene dehydrogenase-like protein